MILKNGNMIKGEITNTTEEGIDISTADGVKTIKVIKSVLGYYETITMETL